MADHYLRWTNTGPGRFVSSRLGLPQPTPLDRWKDSQTTLRGGPLLHLTAGESTLDAPALATLLNTSGIPVRTEPLPEGGRHAAVVVDATGVREVAQLRGVHQALHPVARALTTCARVVVLGTVPDRNDHHQAAAQQALEGFVRSLGKELGRGRTAQLVRYAPGTPTAAATSTLRFLLSPRSAYVSGQVITVGDGVEPLAVKEVGQPLKGRTALVTGASRGIGRAVAEKLALEGARLVVLDVPQAEEELGEVARLLGGTPLTLDITAEDAGERITEALPPEGLDVLVHNAGITRDRRLANMAGDRWDSVLDVNLDSVLRTTDHLLRAGALREGSGRIVGTASIAGIAGNVGQTNYAASKAGVIGLVRSLAPRAAAEHRVTVNAVAPGFIETRMTAAVPLLIRQAGRRMTSLAQGGLPVDVAETVTWLAHPGSGAVNGQVVRVCGQSLLGA
ncbi:3-oxoacyl-ACP reductase [Streptomyces sp. NPDC005438]|uniref:3-oxoacyl-ACP reductase n=1 Tax=Streptomyces sp. NPDC005438 TaxID=3156880 RepID=UPI0033BEF66D